MPWPKRASGYDRGRRSLTRNSACVRVCPSLSPPPPPPVLSHALVRSLQAHKELLQRFGARRDAAIAYMRAVRPDIGAVHTSELTAAEPPLAQTMRGMEALVVSAETEAACAPINAARAAQGMPPVALVVCDLIGGGDGDAEAPKISSSDLRALEAGGGAGGARRG